MRCECSAASCPMKNVSRWREPTATTTTTTDQRHRGCIHGLIVTSYRPNKIIDDISTVWLSIQRMVAVHQGHLLQPQRPLKTPASLLAARLELQLLSMPGGCRQLDTVVDQEVSRLLCRSPSLQFPGSAGRRRTKRRTVDSGTKEIASISHQPLSTRWIEQRNKTSPCRLPRHHEDLKRPCLDFNKMQASQSFSPVRTLNAAKTA